MRSLALLAALVLTFPGACGSSGTATNDSSASSGSDGPPIVDDGGSIPGRGGNGGPITGQGDAGEADSSDGVDATIRRDGGKGDLPPPPPPADGGSSDLAIDSPTISSDGPPPPPPADGPPGMCATGGTCDSLEKEYAAAFQRALVCDQLVKGACQQKAQRIIGCPCEGWVNTTTELDAIRAKYQAAGCGTCRHACPLIACRVLTNGVCGKATAHAAGDPVIGPIPIGKGSCEDQPLVMP